MSDSPQSPPKDVERNAQSPAEEEPMNDRTDPQSGVSYEFEGVKEQDRWLPIANGMSASSSSLMICSLLPAPLLPSRSLARVLLPQLSSLASSLNRLDMPRAFKTDELDANIRNFAPVARIMKNALPDNAKIAKEAKECMQECVSEFISFITSEGLSHALSPLGPTRSLLIMYRHSVRKVPAGEAQDGQRRGHSLCHVLLGIRELRRSPQGVLVQISRGMAKRSVASTRLEWL